MTDIYNPFDRNILVNGYVPYTGATANVNLGTRTLTTSDVSISRDNSAGGAMLLASNTGTQANTWFQVYDGANSMTFGSEGNGNDAYFWTDNPYFYIYAGGTTANPVSVDAGGFLQAPAIGWAQATFGDTAVTSGAGWVLGNQTPANIFRLEEYGTCYIRQIGSNSSDIDFGVGPSTTVFQGNLDFIDATIPDFFVGYVGATSVYSDLLAGMFLSELNTSTNVANLTDRALMTPIGNYALVWSSDTSVSIPLSTDSITTSTGALAIAGGLGVAKNITSKSLATTTGTITTSQPAIQSTQTWNNAGVTFNASLMNITDTASAAASTFVDYQVGGSSRFKVQKDGSITASGGTATLPTAVMSTRLNIPNGATVAAANAGDLALDTTDNQLLAGGATPLVLAMPKKIISVTVPNPTAADDKPIFQMPYAATITKVTATVQGSTSVTFQLQKHAAASLNSAGTNMLTASLTATTTGANTTSFSAATLAAGDFVNFVSSALSGTPTAVVIAIEYTITRT